MLIKGPLEGSLEVPPSPFPSHMVFGNSFVILKFKKIKWLFQNMSMRQSIRTKLEGFCRVIKIIFIGKYVRYKTLLKM